MPGSGMAGMLWAFISSKGTESCIVCEHEGPRSA